MMKRRPDNATPSTVLAAFAPEHELELTVDGWLLLEALESPILRGESPSMRDLIIAVLVMSDEAAVSKARKSGTLDALIRTFTTGRRPADILALGEKVGIAIAAALHPTNSGADSDPDEKKSPSPPVGG